VNGARVADGNYELVIKVTDTTTVVAQRLALTVDTTPPRLRLVSKSRLQFWTNEPATVTGSFGSRRVTKHVRAGYFAFPLLRGARHFSLVATDALGNASRPLRG
jgi:hypothetical protein